MEYILINKEKAVSVGINVDGHREIGDNIIIGGFELDCININNLETVEEKAQHLGAKYFENDKSIIKFLNNE